MNIKNRKAFTLIELIVVIAIIGILVLFGIPRLLGYVEKAHLARIMHDTKVMEAMMEDELTRNLNSNYREFQNNGKDLGLLIEANRLFEKEGHAKNLEYVPMKGEIDGLSKHLSAEIDEDNHEKFGIGGPSIQEKEEFKELYERYKIIPEDYKVKAGSKLKGTFYSNESGKVYYEPDKPIGVKSDIKKLNCSIEPLPDYTFEHEVGKIVKYHGNAEHLVIPSYFFVNDECWPVRIIGKGAFMQGDYKSIFIPDTVITIEEEAFKDINLDEIYIPGSVDKIGKGAFDGNYDVIYGGSPGRINGGCDGNYTRPDGGNGSITYRSPNASQAGVVFNPSTGTIVKGGKGSGGGYIPPYIEVNGIDYPVKKIAKGAYQGLGLITVILPETLEVIEDYAFSGNQLIGIRIPFSVYHIGHYAFSFNEVWKIGNISGPERKATIKTIIIKEEEQFNKVNKMGNIVENGIKVNMLKNEVKLQNHIFVTSIYNDIKFEEYEPIDIPVTFYNYHDSAYDGDIDTGVRKSGELKWHGNLENKEISIISSAGYTAGGGNTQNVISFIDKDGNKIKSFSPNIYSENIAIGGFNNNKSISKILVPEKTTGMKITIGCHSGANCGQIYEIIATNLSHPESIYKANSESTSSSITLNWQNGEGQIKTLIYKDDKFLAIVDGNTYKDEFMYGNETHTYELKSINEFGNAGKGSVILTASTIANYSYGSFRGLTPQAFDGNPNTTSKIGEITWIGNMIGRVIKIDILGGISFNDQDIYLRILNNENKSIEFVNLSDNVDGVTVSHIPITSRKLIKLIIPDDAVKITLSNRYNRGTIYNVSIME